MRRRSPWLDPTSTQAAVALAIVAALVNGLWLLLDHSAPSWDQSNYLLTTLQYKHALDTGGPIELLRAIHHTDPSHGPLFTVLLLPMAYVFGPQPTGAMALNLLLAPVLYFSAGEIAWIIFRDWRARLLTICLVAATPLLVGLYHDVLQDFLLITLATLSLLLLLKSEGFSRRGMTWAMGLAMGLGTLAKVTFPLFVAGPLLVVIARAIATRRLDARRLAVSLGGAALVYLVVTLVWYGPNFSATLDYVRSTTSGPLALGAGPSDPYTFRAIASFTLLMINFNLSWIILLVGLIAVALNVERLRELLSRPLCWEPLTKLAFLLAWAVIPYLSVALAHNQDVRLMAPAFPAVAVLVAGAVFAVRWRMARLALLSFVLVLLAYQTLVHITDVTPSFMPNSVYAILGSYEFSIPTSSEPIGPDKLPEGDYATPVMEYIESVAAVEPGGATLPRTVCMLTEEPIVNVNTFTYLANVRGDPYEISPIVTGPGGEPELERILSLCNFALYIKQPPLPEGEANRIALVNQPFAANHMTPRLFALFRGPSRTFPMSGTAIPKGSYLPGSGNGTVRVLVRTSGQGPIG